MVADDRSVPVSGVSSTPGSAHADRATQSASFEIGGLRLELSASPGAARLVVSAEDARDIYVVDPSALTHWAVSTEKLLVLEPGTGRSSQVEFRAPFLVDREGRSSMAFEALVSELGVSYRLLVTGADEKVAGIMTTAELVRGVAEAAAGAALVAQRSN